MGHARGVLWVAATRPIQRGMMNLKLWALLITCSVALQTVRQAVTHLHHSPRTNNRTNSCTGVRARGSYFRRGESSPNDNLKSLLMVDLCLSVNNITQEVVPVCGPILKIKFGGWMKRQPETNRLDIGTDPDMESRKIDPVSRSRYRINFSSFPTLTVSLFLDIK